MELSVSGFVVGHKSCADLQSISRLDIEPEESEGGAVAKHFAKAVNEVIGVFDFVRGNAP
jgi:hypothetical protein